MEDETFIEDIKNNPQLYNKQNANYKCTKKIELWQMLSKKPNIQNAKKKKASIRERFVREKRKQPSGSRIIPNRPSNNFHLLHFLDDHLKPRKMIENSNVNRIQQEYNMFETAGDSGSPGSADLLSDNNSSDTLLQYENSTSSPVRSPAKRAKTGRDEAHIQFLKSINNFIETLNKKKNDQEDEDMHYLQSIGYKMKKMSEEDKDEFKILMLQSAIAAVQNSKKNNETQNS